MCPTPLLIPAKAAAAAVATTVSGAKEDPAAKAPAKPVALEKAMSEQDSASTEAPVKLSALRGTPAIIDALNAQTRKRAAAELAKEDMTPAHQDYMCFELVRQGAPGKSCLVS